jgi:hypothetical protein
MTALIDHTRLHRTAKYFMDSGRAVTHDHAMDILRGFGASIRVGPEVATSIAHQVALLTLVNLLRRTLLAGASKCSAHRMRPCSFHLRARATSPTPWSNSAVC